MKENLTKEGLIEKIKSQEHIGMYMESVKEALEMADQLKDSKLDFSPYYNQCITKVMLGYNIDDLINNPEQLGEKLMKDFRDEVVYLTLFIWRLKKLI